jgi:hypothetical protein
MNIYIAIYAIVSTFCGFIVIGRIKDLPEDLGVCGFLGLCLISPILLPFVLFDKGNHD